MPRSRSTRATLAIVTVTVLLAGALLLHRRDDSSRSPANELRPRERPGRLSVFEPAAGPRRVIGKVRAATTLAPIQGANVCALRRSASCCTAPACTTTAVDGSFSIDGLTPGEHLVSATAAGFEAAVQPVDVADEHVVILTLPPGGAHLAGTVEDASGGVVPGALVTVTVAAADDRVVGIALTDVAGRFDVSVPSGLVTVTARADGYSRATTEVLAPTDDIRLSLAPGAALTGRVIEHSSGAPVEGIEVVAAKRMGGLDQESVRSGADGQFRLSHLSPGGYQVTATGGRWRSGSHWAMVGIGETTEPLVVEVFTAARIVGLVKLGDQPCTEGLVELDGPTGAMERTSADGKVRFDGVLAGRYTVTLRCAGGADLRDGLDVAGNEDPLAREWNLARGLSVSGTVRTAAGHPAGPVPISVVPSEPGGLRAAASCTSGPDGRFTCTGLAAGVHDCFAAGERGAASNVVTVPVGKHQDKPVELRLVSAANLRVTVTTAAGAPVDRAAVVARRDGNEVATAVRTGRGRYLIASLALGPYELSLGHDPSAASGRKTIQLLDDGATVDVTLIAPAASSIRGRVVNERGEPVADAWVRVGDNSFPLPEADAGYAPAVSADDGRFTVAGLAAGRYAVYATSVAGEGVTRDVEAGREAQVVIRTFGMISGVARDGSGAPVPSFVLTTIVDDGTVRSRRVVDPAGRFSLPWLVPGRWQVRAEAESGAVATEEITLGPGTRNELVLTLQHTTAQVADTKTTNERTEP